MSDQELLMASDGELSRREADRVNSHLATCWSCRTRRREIEATIGDFVQLHRSGLDALIPSSDGPRALLKARLEQLASEPTPFQPRWLGIQRASLAGALLLLAAMAVIFFRYHPTHPYRIVTVPNPKFTPGATVLRSQQELCEEADVKNKAIPPALQERVFAEYGVRSPQDGMYEVDYLITPALGGADDIRNFWPQSSQTTVWNSRVKDELEDHLRALVCDGRLDLATAQREIAGNWIEAYKKYFQTNQPIENLH